MLDKEEAALFCQMEQLMVKLKALRQCTDDTPKADPSSLERQLLLLSCENFWTYDPATNLVCLYDKQQKVKRYSFTRLMQGVGTRERKQITDIFHRILTQQEEHASFSYQREHKQRIYHYEVVVQSYSEHERISLVGVTKAIHLLENRIEQVLQEQEKFDLLLSLSNMFIWEYDVEKREFSANQSLCEKLGLQEQSYSLDQLCQYWQIDQISAFLDHIEQHDLSTHSTLHLHHVQENRELIFETNFKGLPRSDGSYSIILGTMHDITEKELLKTSASKDSLTGCFNRRSADMTLVSTFQKFQNNNEMYTIIFFDVDDFKRINDRYGHDMGDYVLQHICELIQKEIRSSDILFRWGGDEFLLICQGIAKENIYAYIERLRRMMEASEFRFKDNRIQVTISIGASYYYKSDSDYEKAMKRADRSLYKAKIAGRNKVCILK